MSINWRYVMGTVTIVVIVGGTIYAIKKSKDMKKLEGEEITLEQAMAEVEARRLKDMAKENVREEFNEMMDDIHDTAGWNRSFMGDDEYKKHIKYAEADIKVTQEAYVRISEESEDEDLEDDVEDIENDEYIDKHEEVDGELRHDPNSRDAREQFIKMELAEWRPLDDAYQTIRNLFEFPFLPENDGDHDLLTRIIDHRVQFFGFGSKWAKEVTFADVVLYFARQAEFQCGESISHWAEYFLDLNNLSHELPDSEVEDSIEALNNHTYYNVETNTYGLFGLSQHYMDQAVNVAGMNIDTSVTYDIEFNEFLKSYVV